MGQWNPSIQGVLVSALLTGTDTAEFHETRRGRNQSIQGNFDPSSAGDVCIVGLGC